MRQYIGARYVPKFFEGDNGDAWVSGIVYDPLTIVSYLTNYFCSKKSVPATVGSPNANPEYWANIGLLGEVRSDIDALEQSVSQLDARADDLEGSIDLLQEQIEDVEKDVQGKILFLGDSYADVTTGDWVNKCVQMLGLNVGEYWNLAVAGDCFSNNLWLSRLQAWVAANPNEVDNIRTIVVGGGVNDSRQVFYSTLEQRIQAFGDYCFNTFGSKVNVKVFYFGFSLDDASDLDGRTGEWRGNAQRIYATCGKYHCSYVGGGELILHNRSFMSSDGVHPNSLGGTAIAGMVATALRGGVNTVSYSSGVSVTGGYTVSGVFRQEIFGCLNRINLFDVSIDFGSGLNYNGGWITIGNAYLPFGNKMPYLNTNAVVVTTNNVPSVRNIMMLIQNNQLLVAIQDYDGAAAFTGSIKSISLINNTQIINAIAD